jgi:hypothetical protein
MQLEQDDHQRRDAQQQVEEVLEDAPRDRQHRAQPSRGLWRAGALHTQARRRRSTNAVDPTGLEAEGWSADAAERSAGTVTRGMHAIPAAHLAGSAEARASAGRSTRRRMRVS